MSREESANDLKKLLEEEDEEKSGSDKEELEVEKPDSGSEEEDFGAEEDDSGAGEDEEEKEREKEKFLAIPQYKEVTKKYPKLFEDFPNLRHIFFHEKGYRELFPTVEEAREASENLENFRELESCLSTGEQEDIINVLSSIEHISDDALPNLATNFLSSIKKMNQDLYYQVITPELVNFTRVMFDAGLRNENDNLKNAALVAALHFFGDPKVASGEKKVELPSSAKKSVDDEKLEKEKQSFRQERYTSLYNDVVQSSDSSLSKIILNGLDPKEEMTEEVREMASEKIMREITKTLSLDNVHTSKMDSLWKRAAKDNFSGNWKSKIINAYLESAKEIMPKIRARVRANVLGIRERHPENSGGQTRKRIEPESTTGGGKSSKVSDKNLDAKKIDWKKTSDLDLIRGNVTLKNS